MLNYQSDEHDDNDEEEKKINFNDLTGSKKDLNQKRYLLSINLISAEIVHFPWLSDVNIKYRIEVTFAKSDSPKAPISSFFPNWNLQYNFAINLPSETSFINIYISDEKSGTILGVVSLSMRQLIDEGIISNRWINLYGPVDSKSFFSGLLNMFGLEQDRAEFICCGRVLTSAKIIQDDYANTNRETSLETDKPAETFYQLWVDLYEISGVDFKEMLVEIQVGNTVEYSKSAHYLESLDSYSWGSIRMRPRQVNIPNDASMVGDTFIRLVSSNRMNYFGYVRLSTVELIRQKTAVKPQWYEMKSIYVENIGTDEETVAHLLASINIVDLSVKVRPEVERFDFPPYILISNVYMGRDIPLIDGVVPSLSVRVALLSKSIKTEGVKQSLAPKWNETLLVRTFLNKTLSNKVEVTVFNKRNILAQTEIDVADLKLYESKDLIEKDLFKFAKWIIFKHKLGDFRILISSFFVRITKQGKERIDLSAKRLLPEETTYQFGFYVLGLRNIFKKIDLTNGYCDVSYRNKQISDNSKQLKYFRENNGCYNLKAVSG